MIGGRAQLRVISEGWAWIVGRRDRVRVTGQSMMPTLGDGDFVLVDRRRRPRWGDLVVARHPAEQDLLVVKRVEDVGIDTITLVSDNPAAGTDSRMWGPVPLDRLVGVVTLVLDRPTMALGRR